MKEKGDLIAEELSTIKEFDKEYEGDYGLRPLMALAAGQLSEELSSLGTRERMLFTSDPRFRQHKDGVVEFDTTFFRWFERRGLVDASKTKTSMPAIDGWRHDDNDGKRGEMKSKKKAKK